METINNTEPMPHTPQGANGQWIWDGHTTSKHRTVDGDEWLLKGAWRWVQEQKKVQTVQAHKPISVIAKQLKPMPNENHKIEKAFNALFILGGSITLITLLILTAL
tara:strand:- start:2256 stop:2573 length:318 start_codon:yes stop_codon:yes gene_type:complete